MAEIVLGVGSSHSPQLNIPPEHWSVLQEKDRTDRRFDYATLAARAGPALEAELDPAVWRAKYERCHQAMGRIREAVGRIRPDLLVVVGDDQHEQFLDDNMPMFSVYWGEEILVKKAPLRDQSVYGSLEWHRLEQAAFDDEPHTYPGAPAFALHLVEHFRQRGVDVAACRTLREEIGAGHAFTHLYRRLLPEGYVAPVVPVMLNAFYPPNPPTPRRCWEVGEVLREAVQAWPRPLRVGVVASGGLSHFVIDESLDQTVLAALAERDSATLGALSEASLVLGSSEIRCWIVVGAAVGGLPMHVVDYVPCYRSLAGTGCGMGFALWYRE